MKIVFSKNAIKSLQEIIDFLNHRWNDKELYLFKEDLEKFKQSLSDKIISYPKIDSDSKLRFALLGKKQVKVYFDIQIDSVEILLFLPSKGNPDNLIRLLNKD
ncbi:hypothetical protein IX39_05780 [Chryseobacterium formosense]|uniref:Plasmid stabilization protein n=1 Tax=Chryseobacterium formosense TaxID=236814 RepID=A0A085Z6V4_9FLAO|nr:MULTISPECIES: hypothetical protein [Chryseobacterium]KFF00168.1 hypothetical protein IX39_05780 [Chryseobacterium formosense]OCK53420.1 hypothetical protein BA768_02460 [Chryseobacterium sp. CBo1]SFT62679.1 Plasmid stabilization system protein ParE [Chryseobacterium formosense]